MIYPIFDHLIKLMEFHFYEFHKEYSARIPIQTTEPSLVESAEQTFWLSRKNQQGYKHEKSVSFIILSTIFLIN